jgi:nucleoside-diphosphate-sugar epimerase
MTRAAAGKSWTFCEIRPDVIVGAVPQNNAMNMGQALGLFLSLWKDVEGEGSEVRFPGGEQAWTALHTDTSHDILARFHIYASLHPDKTAKRAFNVADGAATTWKEVWPEICAYFGLKGVAPESDKVFNAQAWMEDHRSEWSNWVQKNGLREGALEGTTWKFMTDVIGIPFRRDYDLSASRSVGFTEERPHAEGYRLCFEEMRRARIIP